MIFILDAQGPLNQNVLQNYFDHRNESMESKVVAVEKETPLREINSENEDYDLELLNITPEIIVDKDGNKENHNNH